MSDFRIYVSHDIEFHKEQFGNVIWISKQPFIDKYGLCKSKSVIVHHLN